MRDREKARQYRCRDKESESTETETKKRKLQETIEKESGKDARMGDDLPWMVWMALCRREGCKHGYCKQLSEWKRPVEEKEFGTVECCDRSSVFESVELERGWTVGGLYGHFPVADFDAHRLGRFVVARMIKNIGWSERWCTRIVHAVRTLGRIAMPSHRETEMERTIEDCWWCGKMDCGRAGWTDDFHFSSLGRTKERHWENSRQF